MIECGKCRRELPGRMLNLTNLEPCPVCRTRTRAYAFPAALRESDTREGAESFLLEDEAGCFFHPNKKAVVPCSSCGRFICALCDVELDGRHLCPACLETGKRKHTIETLENQRVLYDRIAMYLALVPLLLMWPVTVITAPISLYVAIRYWNKPVGFPVGGKWRYVLAIILAVLQIVGWLALLISVLA